MGLARELWCVGERSRIDASICEASTERVHWMRFLCTAPTRAPALIVVRHRQLPDGIRIEAPLGVCTYRLDGDTLHVAFEDGPFRAELVLRLAWYIVVTRLGGVLIHASGLTEGTRAIVAAGQSGNGKSTLSRLGTAAGLTLLSDEVVCLFPDGRVAGTPFRSDFDNVGAPLMVPARYFFALEKADHEELKPLSPLDAVQLAMAQCFEVAELALPRAEVRKRLLSFLSHVELRTLAFRKHADAGTFVAQALREP